MALTGAYSLWNRENQSCEFHGVTCFYIIRTYVYNREVKRCGEAVVIFVFILFKLCDCYQIGVYRYICLILLKHKFVQ